MSVTMPPVRQMPSPNYSPTAITHDLVVVHRTEGAYEGACIWLCDPRAKASAHLVMKLDGSAVTQLVPLQYKAWAQVAFNGRAISLEVEGFTRDGFSGNTAQAAAKIVAWLCREYGIPPTWARNGEGKGVCQHHDLGVAGGGHVDCCGVGSPEWLAFMVMVKQAFDDFGPGLLPPFALHGIPESQHNAATSPDIPAPSHGGAARADIPDLTFPVQHATPSGYPVYSVAETQWLLNRAGDHLTIDGWLGARTKAAIEDFQRAHNLTVDGVVGSATRAALLVTAAKKS